MPTKTPAYDLRHWRLAEAHALCAAGDLIAVDGSWARVNDSHIGKLASDQGFVICPRGRKPEPIEAPKAAPAKPKKAAKKKAAKGKRKAPKA